MVNDINLDFHVHTLVSCYGNKGFYDRDPPVSVSRLRNIMDAAFEKKISFVVTDHNTTAAFEALKKNEYKGERILEKTEYKGMGCVLKCQRKERVSKKEYGTAEIYVIRGEEISTKQGHVLAVGIENAIRPRMEIADTCREIKNQQGIAIIAHPYFLNGVGEKNIANLIESNNGLVDGIELNLRDLKASNEGRISFLAAHYELSIFMGSDSHLSEDIGEHGCSLVPEEIFEKGTGRDVIEGIRNLPVIRYCKKGYRNTVLREAVRLGHKHADIFRYYGGLPLRY